jgi:hypothetical protein
VNTGDPWPDLDGSSLRSDLAIDALEMAIFARRSDGLGDLVHHSDRGGNICPFATPTVLPKSASSPRWEVAATRMTRRWFHTALLVDGWVEGRLSKRIPCRLA